MLALFCIAALAGLQAHGESAGPQFPLDSELEQGGYRIGQVRIERDNVFDPNDPNEARPFYRLANGLHVLTRESVVRGYLLFAEGDRYSGRILAESERALRAAAFLADAHIQPVAVHGDRVDIEVRTRDAWTFDPGLSFLRRGGTNTSGISLAQLNLRGTGIAVSAARTFGVDRTESRVDFNAPQVSGSHVSVQGAYASNSDGALRQLFVEQPFYSLDSRWAAAAGGWSFERIDSLYDRGRIVAQFHERSRFAEAYLGSSAGLGGRWVRRWSVGATRDDHEFTPLIGSPAANASPPDRRFNYPWLQLDLLEDDYAVLRNHDQIGRDEDLHMGVQWRTRVGFVSRTFGSDRGAVLVNTSVSHAGRPTSRALLQTSASLDGRLEQSRWHNASVQGSVRYYVEQSSRMRLYAALEGTAAHALDLDHEVLLGGDSGLRGYPLRYQSGTSRALLTLEQRYFTGWYPFRVFRVGGAAFVDAGRTWGRSPFGQPSLGLLRDAGIGLRIANERLGFGGVLHLDLAFPLDGEASLPNHLIVFEARTSW